MGTPDDAQPEVAGAGPRKGLHPFLMVLAFFFAYPLGLLLLFFHPRYGRSKAWWWLGGIWSLIMFVGWMGKGSKPDGPAPQASTPQEQGDKGKPGAATAIGIGPNAQGKVANHDKLNAWIAVWRRVAECPPANDFSMPEPARLKIQQGHDDWANDVRLLQDKFVSLPFNVSTNQDDAVAILDFYDYAKDFYRGKITGNTNLKKYYVEIFNYIQGELGSIRDKLPPGVEIATNTNPSIESPLLRRALRPNPSSLEGYPLNAIMDMLGPPDEDYHSAKSPNAGMFVWITGEDDYSVVTYIKSIDGSRRTSIISTEVHKTGVVVDNMKKLVDKF